MTLKTGNPGAPAIALLGMAALASAIGVGRFALTPLMPLMQSHDGLTFGHGAWLASANYLGYLVGALICSFARPATQRAARVGLVAVAVFTVAMGMTSGVYLWLVLRFAAGIASAYVLVGVSAWALPELSRLGHPAWSGWVYAGVGIGIAAVGLIGLAAGIAHVDPAHVWVVLGAISAVLAALAWSPMVTRPTAAPRAVQVAGRLSTREWRLVFSYGCFGFGYIIPATFLPAMARELAGDPIVFGWAWPVFGAVAAASTVIAIRALRHSTPRRLWSWAMLIMSVGVLVPVLAPGLWPLLLAAVIVGGMFMVITMIGMLEAQRHQGTGMAKLMAAMTAAFAAGQLLGPLVVGMAASQANHPVAGPSLLATAGLWAGTWMLRPRHAELPLTTATRRQP